MDNESLLDEFNVKDSLIDVQEKWIMEDLTFVLFGATGDLAQRKLFPALYNLFLEGKIPRSILCNWFRKKRLVERIFPIESGRIT